MRGACAVRRCGVRMRCYRRRRVKTAQIRSYNMCHEFCDTKYAPCTYVAGAAVYIRLIKGVRFAVVNFCKGLRCRREC